MFDLEQQPLKPAERLLLFEQAKAAMEQAILASDDPDAWLSAGRAAEFYWYRATMCSTARPAGQGETQVSIGLAGQKTASQKGAPPLGAA